MIPDYRQPVHNIKEKEQQTMKIRLDAVMQSFSYPINAVYYYYIPLETVLMFVEGVIYGKAVHGISSEKDVTEHSEDFIKLPQIGEEGRRKVMEGFLKAIPQEEVKARITEMIGEHGLHRFEDAVREERLLIEWYNYRDEIYCEFSRRWSEANGLDLIE
jgi:hypothetical protein